jgi:hypothetical protein
VLGWRRAGGRPAQALDEVQQAQAPAAARRLASPPWPYNDLVIRTSSEAAAAVERLIDVYRTRCLWFLRSDYYPSTDPERLVVLRHIEKHGDREAYRRAAAVRQWLSLNSSAASAAS